MGERRYREERMTRRLALLLSAIALTLCSVLPAVAQRDDDLSERFVCIYRHTLSEPVPEDFGTQWGSRDSITTNQGVPFVYSYPDLGMCSCSRLEDGWPPCYMSQLPTSLSGVFTRLHALTYLGFAADLPNGYLAGQLVVVYEDGAESILDLVAGVNTAEYGYGTPETQACLRHTQMTPACFEHISNRPTAFFVYYYHVTLDLETKPIATIEARMPETACSPRRGCDGEQKTALQVSITALTLER
jgi:hypothetical protein